MAENKPPLAINAIDVPPRAAVSFYPEPFATRMIGRQKRPLGDLFGLKNFGVNLTRLAPNAMSALRHAHTKQDEFVYVVQGEPTLRTNEGSLRLAPGMCVGFPAGTGNAHHLHNETTEEVLYLEVGDRTAGDAVDYPDDDIRLVRDEGKLKFLHKDGTPY
ncbi:MAG TPA: cupin domain-containing protein [Burkholderiales bacterium]|nr:cupin domain-containing protein [Burkholderiales bacterium]